MKNEYKLNPCRCGDVPTIDKGSMNHVLACSCGVVFMCRNDIRTIEGVVCHWNKLHPTFTPNCGICEHSFANYNNDSEATKAICTAQGYKLCAVAYNTPECQKLYKPEEVE